LTGVFKQSQDIIPDNDAALSAEDIGKTHDCGRGVEGRFK
jgi:hypothetical protein